MAFASVNGSPVLYGRLSLPRIGIWNADVEMPAPADGSATLTGRATLVFGSLTFVGTFLRSGLDRRGRICAHLCAGAAGLGKTVPAKSYLGAPLRLPLQDLLTDCGERLSTDSDAATLAFQLPAWLRMQGVAGPQLRALVDSAGATWRALSDGSIWVGVERWPQSSMQALAIGYEADRKRRTVASLNPTIFPGQVYQGQRVVYVEHVLGSRSLRTVLEVE
jgi:hypothetical protein